MINNLTLLDLKIGLGILTQLKQLLSNSSWNRNLMHRQIMFRLFSIKWIMININLIHCRCHYKVHLNRNNFIRKWLYNRRNRLGTIINFNLQTCFHWELTLAIMHLGVIKFNKLKLILIFSKLTPNWIQRMPIKFWKTLIGQLVEVGFQIKLST
jgi:hypothetical protein